jgi:hypothetical protein
MSKFDKNKFVFHETFTNSSGKTSGSGFVGVILGIIAALSFIATMVGYFMQIPNTLEVMKIIINLVFSSALLLGVRKVSSRFGSNEVPEDGSSDDSQPNQDSQKG